MTRIEKETVITYNEAEETADIFTFNKALQNKLDKLCQERPESVKNTSKNQDGSKAYIVPKKYVKVNATRKYTDSTLRKMAENMKRLHHSKAEE